MPSCPHDYTSMTKVVRHSKISMHHQNNLHDQRNELSQTMKMKDTGQGMEYPCLSHIPSSRLKYDHQSPFLRNSHVFGLCLPWSETPGTDKDCR